MRRLLPPGSVRRTGAVNRLQGSSLLGRRARRWVLRRWGAQVGAATVAPHCFFGSADVRLADGAFLNYGCFLDTSAPIAIGRDVAVGIRTTILTSSHAPGDRRRRAGAPTGAAVTIEDGCWIGARVTILPGTTVGAGCVVAAGAVVAEDCAPDGLYAGVPARRVRDLP